MALLPPTCESPEFEFNPCFPSPTSLHSADQLFSNGHLLPLHLLPTSDHPLLIPDTSEIPDPPEPDPSPSILSAGITASKRWSHVFKKSDKKSAPEAEEKAKSKENKKNRDKKRETRKPSASSAELNINLWPFSRSSSAGNSSSGRTRSASVSSRKVSSAPCSRSNSAGDSKTRRNFPVSPVRPGGVYLGRTSPVWQLPRTVSGKAAGEPTRRNKPAGVNKNRVLNLRVPMCIGYRHHLSCRTDEASVAGTSAGDDGGDGGSRISGGSTGNLFSIRSLFSKKVY